MNSACGAQKNIARKHDLVNDARMLHYIDMFRHHYWQRRGQRMLQRGKSAAAFRCFQKAVLLQNEPEDRFHLALALVGLGQYEDALAYLDKVAQQEPDREVVLLAQAECNLMLRRWQQAEDQFARLAGMRAGSKRYAGYLEMVRDPVQRDKHVIAREYFNESQKLVEQKQPRQALQKMQEALEVDPHNALVANNVGSLMLLLGHSPGEACLYFEKAVALEPDNQRYRENLSWVRRKSKR